MDSLMANHVATAKRWYHEKADFRSAYREQMSWYFLLLHEATKE